MKTKKVSQKEDETLLYSVNLKTLTIEVHDNTPTNHGYHCKTTTYENFVVDNSSNQDCHDETNDNILYFKTKEEALEFIKSQLGM